MTAALTRRIVALENLDCARPLPDVVADSTTDTELARLRQHNREVYRVTEFVELCLVS